MKLAQLERESFVAQKLCRYGTMHFLRTDFWIARSLGLYGEFSESEIAVWRHLVKPGENVVSAGANCGAHVVWWSQHVGPHGKVFTTEPQEVLFEVLKRNLETNGCANVEAHCAALGREAGKLPMWAQDYRYPASFGSARVGGGAPGTCADSGATEEIEVPVMTIDEMVGDRDVRLIHLDVEGAEPAALIGAAKTIDRCRPYLFVEVDNGTKDIIGKVFAAAGYEMLIHQGPLFNPDNFAGNPVNVFGATVSINALGLPRGGA